MKKNCLTIIMMAVAGIAYAGFIQDFSTWDNLIERSPHIIIAKAVVVRDLTPKKSTAIIDNEFPSAIEVVSVLKGSTKPGPSQISSQYVPRQGEQFLLFANYEDDSFFRGYVAAETYKAIPLTQSFQASQLAGKPLKMQIALALSNRLDVLKAKPVRDTNELSRLEEYFNPTTNGASMKEGVSRRPTGGGPF